MKTYDPNLFQLMPIKPDNAIIGAMVNGGVSRVAVPYHYGAMLRAGKKVVELAEQFKVATDGPQPSILGLQAENRELRDWCGVAGIGSHAAMKTLQGLGYTYHGGERWKPPLGKPAAKKDPAAMVQEAVDVLTGNDDQRLCLVDDLKDVIKQLTERISPPGPLVGDGDGQTRVVMGLPTAPNPWPEAIKTARTVFVGMDQAIQCLDYLQALIDYPKPPR